ncbi:MAG: hypothetical protein D6687_03125 [Acidobacteria bacterium]|nr:MAG: hypothetical protein D6687_03125 [Acidobacteriota bacterium]
MRQPLLIWRSTCKDCLRGKCKKRYASYYQIHDPHCYLFPPDSSPERSKSYATESYNFYFNKNNDLEAHKRCNSFFTIIQNE